MDAIREPGSSLRPVRKRAFSSGVVGGASMISGLSTGGCAAEKLGISTVAGELGTVGSVITGDGTAGPERGATPGGSESVSYCANAANGMLDNASAAKAAVVK